MKKVVVTVGRSASFEMAHKLVGASTRECNDTIHGHSYKWGIELTGTCNAHDMVIDYGEMKKNMAIINDVFDHSVWVPRREDVELLFTTNAKILYMKDMNPTAESMCILIMNTMLRWPVTSILDLSRVKVWVKETEDSICSVEVFPNLVNMSLPVKTVFDFSNEVLEVL